MTPSFHPTRSDFDRAAAMIEPFVPDTPVFRSDAVDREVAASVFFKMESLMPHVGSFKVRGALHALLCLSGEERAKGVVTHSSGNHGQAVSWAARKLGMTATVVMPHNSPEVKKRGVREFGGRIVECPPDQFLREETCRQIQEETGATVVPPFNHENIIIGQGTCLREFIAQVMQMDGYLLDAVVVPVGGGGLIAGSALAARAYSPSMDVIGVEPSGADDAYRSLKAGSIQPNTLVNTIADGLRTTVGDKTFPVIQEYVKEILLVDDADIVDAMRIQWERLRAIVEPSGAVPFAAIRKNNEFFAGKRVGVVVSGGNVDLQRAFELMDTCKGSGKI